MKKSLRIRVLAGDLAQYAGGPLFKASLIEHLVNRGHEVSVICFDAHDQLKKICNVYEIGRSPWRDHAFVWNWAYQLDMLHIKRMMKPKMLQPADIVIGFEHLMFLHHNALDSTTPLIYIPLSLIAPLEIQSYGRAKFSRNMGIKLFHKLQVWGLNNSALTIRFTKKSCKMLDQYYGSEIHPDYLVSPIAVDIPEHVEDRSIGNAIRFLSVGRLTESKNASLILEALGKLKDYKWCLEVVGEGPERNSLIELASTLGISNRISFPGRVSDVADSYKQANLFLFASKLDNSPLVILEAMGQGVPCLAMNDNGTTYRNANEEIINNRTDGLLAADEYEFGELLREILEEPSILVSLGRSARMIVSNRNSWDAFCGELENSIGQAAITNRDCK